MKAIFKKTAILLSFVYLAGVVKYLFFLFFNIGDFEDYGFKWRLWHFWDRIIPNIETYFIGGHAVEVFIVLPIFLFALYFAKNKFQLYILPCILGSIILFVFSVFSFAFINIDNWQFILRIVHVVLSFSIPYLFLVFSYTYLKNIFKLN